jgi:hypothetical protein
LTRWFSQFLSADVKTPGSLNFTENGSLPEFRSPPLEEEGGKSLEQGKPFSELFFFELENHGAQPPPAGVENPPVFQAVYKVDASRRG